jgi:DNA-binding CsgD family transcriptional regulator
MGANCRQDRYWDRARKLSVRFHRQIARLDGGDFMMTTNNYGVSRADTSRSEHQVNVPSVMHPPFNHLQRIGLNAGNNASGSAPEEEPLHERIEKLKALGLTGRQAEVAFWIAQGKTNDDLAIILNTSHHTIPHHVEAILGRLHLATRAEIMLCTLETLGWLRWPTKPRKRQIHQARGKNNIVRPGRFLSENA